MVVLEFPLTTTTLMFTFAPVISPTELMTALTVASTSKAFDVGRGTGGEGWPPHTCLGLPP
jgi:hypothetical protein